MKLKRTPITIPSDKPFQNDLLSREQYARILTDLVASIEDPLALSLEAGWGHGKTTFIRMWLQQLKNEEFACLYFNAWDADHAQDPLIPFVGEISGELSKLHNGGSASTSINQRLETLKKAGGQIAKRSIPVAVKLLTAGLLELDDFSEKALADTYEKLIKEKFDEYDSDKAALATFRESLKGIVEHLKNSGFKLPIVFFVDELDRCRPTFAIALLERIKHLFEVPGIVFVLAVDRSQLIESVRGVYGSGCDAVRYLRRFIDLEYSLPEPSPEAYAHFLVRDYGLDKAFPQVTRDPYADKQFTATFSVLSQVYGLRLRDQGYAFSLLSIAWSTLKKGDHVNPFIAAFLIAFRVSDLQSYKRLLANEITLNDILSTISKHPIGATYLSNNTYGSAFQAFLITYLEGQDFVIKQHQALRKQAMDATNGLDGHTEIMLDILSRGSQKEALNKLIRRLSLAEQFVKE